MVLGLCCMLRVGSTQADYPEYSKTADVVAIISFLFCATFVIWHRSVYDNWLSEYDIFTFFLPWYGQLGDRLRDFDIPGWTPFFSSGSPVAGDPSGGWMYAPAMLTFTFLSVESAFKTMIALQLFIGGTATFIFSRVIGFHTLAASMSMFTFAFGPFLYGQTHYATVGGQVSTWIPVGLLAVEKAARATSWPPKILWWALGGFALGQMAVSWPGQGFINGAMILIGWIFYRYLLPVENPSLSEWHRARAGVGASSMVLLFGLGLSAAGFLPRLATNLESSIPGGDYSKVMGGDYLAEPHNLTTLLSDLFVNDLANRPVAISGVLFSLMILGLLLSHKHHAVPFFGTVFAFGLILSFRDTPLHRLFYLIPEFENVHQHSPRRLLWVLFLAPSMLAGAAVQALPTWWNKPRAGLFIATPMVILALVDAYLTGKGVWIGWTPYITAGLITLLALAVVSPVPAFRYISRDDITTYALVAMLILAFVFPAGRDIHRSVNGLHPPGTLLSNDAETQDLIDQYVSGTDPEGAGAFLQARVDRTGPFRYVGYAGRNPETNEASYSSRRRSPEVMNSLLNGRSFFLGLEQISGYNPLHLKYYVDYIDAMNGGPQDYHWLDPYPTALLGSNLLNMLNVRFIVVSNAEEQFLKAMAEQDYSPAYVNANVTIFENPRALPRAWIVHQVRANNNGEGLAQLATGSVNPLEVAFVNGDFTGLPQSDNPASPGVPSPPESVKIISHQGDHIVAEVTAQASGLVVFSEVYARGWRATLDGKHTPLWRTNHALRGVEVPSGTHVIELAYAPKALTIGMWCTGLTAVALFGVSGAVIADRVGAAPPFRLPGHEPANHMKRSLFHTLRSGLPLMRNKRKRGSFD